MVTDMIRKTISTVVILLLVFTSVFFTGCSGNEKPLSNSDKEIKKAVNEEYQKLQKKFTEKPAFEKLCDYVIKSKVQKKIKVVKKASDYMVMSLPATDSYKESETITLQIPNGLYDINKQNQMFAVLITTLRETGAHPRIKIMLTDVAGRNFKGAGNVEEKYLDTGSFIGMIYSPTVSVYNKGAASAYPRISSDYKQTRVDYECTYRFSISGIKKDTIDDAKSLDKKPSAVKELSNFITSAKSSGKIFRIAYFIGGESAETFATEASAVLVFPLSEKSSFISSYNKKKEAFEEEYGEKEPNASFSMITQKNTSEVISSAGMDKIVNLLYTLDSGIKRDEKNSVSSVINPGKIYLKDGKFMLDICVRDTDKDSMTDTLNGFETACGLFKTNYKLTDSSSPWVTHEDSILVKYLSEKADCAPETIYNQTENSVFKARKADLNTVNYGVNIDHGLKSVKALAESFTGLER